MEFLQLYTKQPVLHWSNQTLEFFHLMLYNFFHINQMQIKQNLFFSINFKDTFFLFHTCLTQVIYFRRKCSCVICMCITHFIINIFQRMVYVIVMSKDIRETKSLQHIIRTTEMIMLFRKMNRLAKWKTKKGKKQQNGYSKLYQRMHSPLVLCSLHQECLIASS